MSDDKPTCGRCGVYRHLHPTDRCAKSRRSYWTDEHSIFRHITAWLWIHALTHGSRWWIAERFHARGLDWCTLFDSIHYADQWDDERGTAGYTSLGYGSDYREPNGCLCDFPLPHEAGKPRPGWCYCPPADAEVSR